MKNWLKKMLSPRKLSARSSAPARSRRQTSRPSRSIQLSLESLEDRLLLSLVPTSTPLFAAGNAGINQYLSYSQSVARAGNGNFAMTWQDTDGVYVRLFNSSAAALTNPILVSSSSVSDGEAAVAMNSAGQFAVAWTNPYDADLYTGSGPGTDIYVQRFTAAGALQGNAIEVTSSFTGDVYNSNPSIAMDTAGDFAVAYIQNTGSSNQARVARVSAAGTLESDVAVAGQASGNEFSPKAAMNELGAFVVAYGYGQNVDGSDEHVWAQRFDAAGNALGAEQVSTFSSSDSAPTVAINSSGEFVVACRQVLYTGTAPSFADIIATRFDAQGTPHASTVIATGVGEEANPSVALDDQGNYVVAYDTRFDPQSTVWVRSVNSSDQLAPGAMEVPVTIVQANQQENLQPSVALDGQGGAVLDWMNDSNTSGTQGLSNEIICFQTFKASSYRIEASLPAGRSEVDLTNGTSQAINVTIYRDPGFSGAVNLSIAGTLPAGVTWSASAADPNYPSVETRTITLRAATSLSGDGFATVSIQAQSDMEPEFGLPLDVRVTAGGITSVSSSAGAPSGYLAWGTTITIYGKGLVSGSQVQFQTASGTINVSPSASSSDGTWLQVVVPDQAVTNSRLTVLTPAGASFVSAQTFTIGGGVITGFSPTVGNEPMDLRPGTTVTVDGYGFAPGSSVRFGINGLTATPTSISSDGTWLAVNVPQGAISGPLSIVRSNHTTPNSSQSFTVHFFRDTNAFSFSNNTFTPDVTFQNVSDAFGYAATHVSVDDVSGPAGWAAKQLGINVTTPAPSPQALAFTAAAAAALNGNGECFGMDLGTQFLQHQPGRITNEFTLPAGAAPTVFNLSFTADLASWLEQLHLYQYSNEFLNYWARWQRNTPSASDIFNLIQSQLQNGEHPLISLEESVGDGHVVVAYNLTGTPDNFTITTYDPDRTYGVDFPGGENTGATHLAAEVASNVTVSNGQWSFNFGNSPWSGGFGSLVVVPWGTVPDQPTLPNVIDQLSSFAFGSSGSPPLVSVSRSGEMTIDAALFAAGSTNTLSISGDSTAGLTVNLNGTSTQYSPGTVTSINYYGGAGNDSFDLEQTPAGVPVTLYLGSGNDIVNFGASAHTLGGLGADVNVVGGQGTDTVNVYDQANGGATTYTLDGGKLSRSGAGTIHYSWIDNVNIYGGSAADTYNVANTEKKFTTTLNVPGAGSSVNVQATTGPLALNISGSSATVVVSDAASTLNGIQGAVSINGQGASTTLKVIDAGNPVSENYTVSATSIQRSIIVAGVYNFNIAPINYANIGHVAVFVGTAQTGLNQGAVYNTLDVVGTAANTVTDLYGNNNGGQTAFAAYPYVFSYAGPILGAVHFHGSSIGYDTVSYVDYFNPTAQTYTMTAGQMIDNGFVPVTYDGLFYGVGLETAVVGGNKVNVISTSAAGQLDTLVQANSGDVVTVGSQAPNFGGSLAGLADRLDIGTVYPSEAASVMLDDTADTQMGKQVTFSTVSSVWEVSGLAPQVIELTMGTGSSVSVLGGSPAAGQSGSNTYNVQSTPAGTSLMLKTGSGGDLINMGNPTDPSQPTATSSLSAIQGLLTVHGQGNTKLFVNDQGTTTDQQYDIWKDHIDWAPSGVAPLSTHINYDGLANLVLDGSSGSTNSLGVASTAAGTTTVVNGHGPYDEFGVSGGDDTLNGIQGNLNLHARAGAVYSYVVLTDWLNTGSHTYRLSSPGASQNEIERFDMQGNRDMAPITYQGQDEEIFYTPQRGGQVINLESNAGPSSTFSTGIFTDVTTAAGDTVNLGRPNPNGPGRLLDQIQFEVVVSSYSNTGSPTINVDDSGDSTPRQATFDTNSYSYNITGLGLPTTTYYGQPFQSLIYLGLSGGGTVHALGGSGGNVFKVNSAPSFALSLDGGAGMNWLDYSGYGSGVSVNLASKTATGLTGISRIENVVGSRFNDTLTGDAANNILLGLSGNDSLQAGSGRAILIGGDGNSTLQGGSGQDILIGGWTAYDRQVDPTSGTVTHVINYAALDALMAEWGSSDSWATRQQALSSGVGSGRWALNTTTVFDDSVADTLVRGGGKDWIFAGRNDIVH
jgi:hypothetical protein